MLSFFYSIQLVIFWIVFNPFACFNTYRWGPFIYIKSLWPVIQPGLDFYEGHWKIVGVQDSLPSETVLYVEVVNNYANWVT